MATPARKNSADILDLPVSMRVQIWNIRTNGINWISKKQYERLMGSDEEVVKGGIREHSEYAKHNYRVDNLTGRKRTIYHIDSGMSEVSCMTDELWDEIKRRNPPSPLNKDESDKPYEHWKRYLATSKEAISILDSETPEQKLLRELSAKVAQLEKKEVKKEIPVDTVTSFEQIQPVTDEQIEEEITGISKQTEKPKRGRKKKEL